MVSIFLLLVLVHRKDAPQARFRVDPRKLLVECYEREFVCLECLALEAIPSEVARADQRAKGVNSGVCGADERLLVAVPDSANAFAEVVEVKDRREVRGTE